MIKLLSAEVASQIAAGEVIERPASVLKELLENSIDAGATKIDVVIQRGGIQLIQVSDNGAGIIKQDLALALQQHATSKISNVHDLAAINSLGFRGEALASINSVAKFSIISHSVAQDQAWSISGSTLSAAAHPIGTTVAMRDLFYNVPARRKFLRSERTEQIYIEEVFRRVALSRLDLAFSLTNHDKLLKNLPACKDQAARTRRLANLCSSAIIDHAVCIDAEQNGLRLWGWLGSPQHARSQESHQYFFINQRVIRDRLINHAIRQVYQPLCLEGKMPFFCLYLELDPVALDVNVHPTKHEVRFRDSRIIHAFLTQTLNDALAVAEVTVPVGHFNHIHRNNFAVQTTQHFADQISIFENKIIIAHNASRLMCIDIAAARTHLLAVKLSADLTPEPLLPPLAAKLPQRVTFENRFAAWCASVGVKLDQVGESSVLLRSLPRPLLQEKILPNVLLLQLYTAWVNNVVQTDLYNMIAAALDHTAAVSISQAQDLVKTLPNLPLKQVWREFSVTDLQQLVSSY